jgi:hypothetical protein
MRQITVFRAGLFLTAAAASGWFGLNLVQAAETDTAWSAPPAMALRRVSSVDPQQHESGFLNNLDCNLATYRLRDSDGMQTGCFAPTALGLLDGDKDVMIFNGTDEGQQLLPYGSHQVFEPWPGSGLISLVPDSIAGSYIGLYRNPAAAFKDEYSGLSPLLAKRMTAPPDINLTGPDGKPLIINPQTMAFSEGGSWLVAEDLSGSFVRIDLGTLEMLPFAQSFGTQGSPGLLQSQVAVSPDGRYVAIANKDASSLKVYDLDSCSGSSAGLRPLVCPAYDYQPFISRQISGFLTARHLRFLNEGLLSFEAQDGPASRAGAYVLAPRGSIRSLTDYIGLGDSYTSGEGAFDYLSGTDTPDDGCHLSVRSYPILLSQDLFGSGGHSVACSGAVINDIGSRRDNYRGQVRGVPDWHELQQTPLLDSILGGYRPGYIAQQRFVGYYQPQITTVSVGGNDIGFGDILQTCVTPHLSPNASSNTCYASYEDRLEVTRLIDRTIPRWGTLFRQLQAAAPDGRLYVIGYPQIVFPSGSCGLNVYLDGPELQFAGQVTDYLNYSIRQAAQAAGVTYVDISQALTGHRLCETAGRDPAVNGLTVGTDAGPIGLHVLGKESYHPNAFGQRLIEQAILRQTGNLATNNEYEAGPVPTAILNAPKSGRTINTVIPDDAMARELLYRGQPFSIHVNGQQDGLRPDSSYTVSLNGGKTIPITTLGSGQDGSIDAVAALPEITPAGGYSLTLTGRNLARETLVITRPVYVASSTTNTDDNGVVGQAVPLNIGMLSTSVGPAGKGGSVESGRPASRPLAHPPVAKPLKSTAARATAGPGPYVLDWVGWLWLPAGLWAVIILGALAGRLLQ